MRRGAEALRELTLELRRDDVELVVARMRPQVRGAAPAAGVVDAIGAERFFPTVRAAVAAYVERAASCKAERFIPGARAAEAPRPTIAPR